MDFQLGFHLGTLCEKLYVPIPRGSPSSFFYLFFSFVFPASSLLSLPSQVDPCDIGMLELVFCMYKFEQERVLRE